MVQISFANPNYLWILLLVPFLIILHFFTLKQKKTAAIKFSNFEALERVSRGDILGNPYKGFLRNKSLRLLLIRAFIYCLLILAVAGTTLWYEGKTSNFDYVFAIDTSSSMLAEDLKPSRLEAAKQAAISFVDIVPRGDKIGIVTFASISIIELMSSSDSEKIKNTISNIELQEVGGTAIGDAIITSSNLFQENKSKLIILLTDGQSNAGIEPDLALNYAKQKGITIHTIGVATPEGGNVSELGYVSKLDEELMKRIAEQTNGKFYIANNAQTLMAAFREIATSHDKQVSLNISFMLLIIAILLLGIEWILVNTIYKTIP